MATAELRLGSEELDVINLIKEQKNFLLSGGAGSGKTYSLVQIIRYLLSDNSKTKIACITYTRSARDEIRSRIIGENLRISTIHDFLWDCIKSYKYELKKLLIQLMNEKKTGGKDKEARVIQSSFIGENRVPESYFNDIEEIIYRDVRNLSKGIISHDEVLIVANRLFKEYPKLRRIAQDRFKYIFIDEYQDTFENVIEIFLKLFTKHKTVIGCFGDEMQSIYDKRIGNLNSYISNKDIYKIEKTENRRNPRSVIDLANKLRIDTLQQEPSQDINAPNMENGRIIQGNIKFFYTQESLPKETIKNYLTEKYQWNFLEENTENTKELNLTHNLIADQAGFKSLMDIYDGDRIIEFRDRIKAYIKDHEIVIDSELSFKQVLSLLKEQSLDSKNINPTPKMQEFITSHPQLYKYAEELPYTQFEKLYIHKDLLFEEEKLDPIIKYLLGIQNMIELYQNSSVSEFLRQSEYKIQSINDKNELKKIIEDLIVKDSFTIHEAIEFANKHNIRRKSDTFEAYIRENSYLYKRLSVIKFSIFQNYYKYYMNKTPFSTQHKIKGQEFDDVLVILDNGQWNNYNFEYLFTKPTNKQSVLERTQKIFYVCCTRAKKRLVVFYQTPSEEVVRTARGWFGKDNVIELPETV